MARRVKRTRAGGLWSESRFWGFIRSALRKAYTRYPVGHAARKRARRPYEGENKRQKWEYQCAGCGRWFPDKEVQVDHIEPIGSLNGYDDLPGFVERLFCEEDGLQILCRAECHASKTAAERKERLS